MSAEAVNVVLADAAAIRADLHATSHQALVSPNESKFRVQKRMSSYKLLIYKMNKLSSIFGQISYEHQASETQSADLLCSCDGQSAFPAPRSKTQGCPSRAVRLLVASPLGGGFSSPHNERLTVGIPGQVVVIENTGTCHSGTSRIVCPEETRGKDGQSMPPKRPLGHRYPAACNSNSSE
jgi:hypothetical protein